MDPTCQVSVVIPTYNRAHYITDAVDSVLAQTYTDYEVIVVDDGSKDETPEVLRRYGDRIKVIRRENGGVCAALNTGIEATRGTWVAFLDSDDEWLPEKLSVQMADLAKRPDLCGHFTNMTFVFSDREAVNLFGVRGFDYHGQRHLVFEKPLLCVLKNELVARSAFLVRRDILLKAGPFDPRLSAADDRDLLMRVALRGPWGCCTDSLVKYCRRPDGLVTLSRRFQDNEKYLHECNIYAYEKLLSDPELTPVDRREVLPFLSGRLFGLGLCQRREGDKKGAAQSFRRSVRSNPTVKSIVKYAMTLLPSRIGSIFLQRFENQSTSGFRA